MAANGTNSDLCLEWPLACNQTETTNTSCGEAFQNLNNLKRIAEVYDAYHGYISSVICICGMTFNIITIIVLTRWVLHTIVRRFQKEKLRTKLNQVFRVGEEPKGCAEHTRIFLKSCSLLPIFRKTKMQEWYQTCLTISLIRVLLLVIIYDLSTESLKNIEDASTGEIDMIASLQEN